MKNEFYLKPMLKTYRYALGSIAGAALLLGAAAALTVVVLKRQKQAAAAAEEADLVETETPETLEVIDESEAPCCCDDAPAEEPCCPEAAEGTCCCDETPAPAAEA